MSGKAAYLASSFLLIAVLLSWGGAGNPQEAGQWYSGRSAFNKRVLMVSNIRFCRELIAGDNAVSNELAASGIVPLAENRISRKEPAIVYYEIYNLDADTLQNVRYRVQFVVQQSALNPVRKGKVRNADESVSPEIFLSLEHQIVSRHSRQANYTQVDLQHLREGFYEFMIIVSDQNASQNAVGQKHFELMP